MANRTAFPNISAAAWEHPTDRAALNALRRIPAFDVILRKVVSLLGEKSIRLSFKANAVRVTEDQYPWLHKRLLRVCDILDVEDVPELYVSQTPLVNAGAVGLDEPFIVINSSMIEILDRKQVEAVLGHEVAHIVSGHALYRTMLIILLRFSFIRYPIAGVAVRPVLYALLEWSRRAELSCDRAGLLAVQDPEVSLSTLMCIAGGARGHDLNLEEFVKQSDEYRGGGDILDGVYKVLSMLGTTHPFAVVRVAELRDWIDAGDYERILGGDYRTRDDDESTPYSDDLGDAAADYTAKAKVLYEEVGSKVGTIAEKVSNAWR